MLYEYNGKIYVKPLVNKIVEVTIEKKDNEWDIKPTEKMLYITPEIKENMIQVTNEEAHKVLNNSRAPKKSSLDL